MVPEDVKQALKQLGARLPDYRLFGCYYDGEQRLAFASEKFKSLFMRVFRDFSDNMCQSVVDAVADRLALETVKAQGTGAVGLQARVDDFWRRNRMDRRANEVHNEALISGDAYVLVWPSKTVPAMATVYPQTADSMTVRYDPEDPGVVLWAMKTWLEPDGRRRLTMYYPDRIEKYTTPDKASGFAQLKPESFVEFDRAVTNPYARVPVFHFANNAAVGAFGRSELKLVVPLQDGLNKAITDMLVAMEFVALPQRWVAGLELKYNPSTGKVEWPFEAGVDRIWAVDNPEAKFGEFSPANLEHFLKTQDSFRLEVARVSRTPLHYVMMQTGDFPSGEAQKTAEAPFLSKVRDRMTAFGDVWEDVTAFALQVMGGAEGADLEAQWADPQPHSDKEQAETLAIDATLPAPLLRKRGYTDEEVLGISSAQQAQVDLMQAFTNAPAGQQNQAPGLLSE